jgi:hypothetical protein
MPCDHAHVKFLKPIRERRRRSGIEPAVAGDWRFGILSFLVGQGRRHCSDKRSSKTKRQHHERVVATIVDS